jgi:4-methylaminobutanoate oxidase (formaldehyde-forming)
VFAAEIARMVGVRVPIVPMSHQYVVTEAMFEHRETPLPSLRDPDLLIYYRQEVDGLVMGGYERQSLPWTASASSYDRIPADFNGRLLSPDHDRFVEISENAAVRVPSIADVGIRSFINGPEAFTPDNEVLPRADRRRRVLRGGRLLRPRHRPEPAASAGDGRVGARGAPPMDLHMDVGASGSPTARRRTLARTVENYGPTTTSATPHGRALRGPARCDGPGIRVARGHGASFGEVRLGTGQPSTTQRPGPTRRGALGGWAGRHWSPAIVAEHAPRARRARALRRVVVRQDRGERR